MIPVLIIRALSPIDLEPPRELPPRASRSGRVAGLGLTGLSGIRPNSRSFRSGRAREEFGRIGARSLGSSRLRELSRFGRFRSGIREIIRSGREPGFGRLEELLGRLGRIP